MKTSVKTAYFSTFAIAMAIAGLSGAAQATTITGTFTLTSGTVDLTQASSWVRISSFDTQSSGGTGLSLFSQLNWTSGTFGSAAQANLTTAFIPPGTGPIAGSRYPVVEGGGEQPTGSGYQIMVTNNSAFPQTLSVYTGQVSGAAQVTAGDFSLVNPNPGGGEIYGVWTINIPANYGTLVVDYTLNTQPIFYANTSVFGATLIAVPEPSSVALLGVGGMGLLAAMRRRRT